MIADDPVCHMPVPTTSYACELEGIQYVFCSEQCRERFVANPRLYIGFPGHKAPAQQGTEIIRRRTLILSEPLDAVQSEQVKHALLSMMGIREICIDGNTFDIQYDLMQVNTEQIAERLNTVGSELGGGWVERLKFAFINYQEECEISSLEVRHGKSCH